jgi:predicted Ser/Thr protein kinase
VAVVGEGCDVTQGVRTVGRYEVLDELGRGGMATVYLARQAELNRLAALKELGALRGDDPSFAQRFLREARLAGSLSHPNIVTVYEYFEHEGVPYIAMEYVERGSLRPYVGRMALAQVAGVLEAVLSGLAHAEKHGIVHRDLKPENLMVTADGQVKIADFGIAKATTSVGATSSFMTAAGTAVGTPNYMAPEQALGEQVGPWSDLYSVGVIAFELFLGRLPFADTQEPMALLLRQINEHVPALTELDPSIDPHISDWVDQLLAKEPAERPQSAAEAWDLLEGSVIGQLGPRWRRQAALPEVPGALVGVPPGPYTPPPAGAPTGPLTGRTPVARRTPPTRPLGDEAWLAATTPPRAPVATPPTVPVPAPRKHGFLLLKAGLAVAALAVALAAAANLRGGSGGAGAHGTDAATRSAKPAALSARGATTPASTAPASKASLQQAAATARSLARQYSKAAAQVSKLAAGGGGSGTQDLAAALKRTAADYSTAAAAAQSGDAVGYAAAMAKATEDKKAVDAATGQTQRAGSRVSGQGNGSSSSSSDSSSSGDSSGSDSAGSGGSCAGDSQSDDPSDDACGGGEP